MTVPICCSSSSLVLVSKVLVLVLKILCTLVGSNLFEEKQNHTNSKKDIETLFFVVVLVACVALLEKQLETHLSVSASVLLACFVLEL